MLSKQSMNTFYLHFIGRTPTQTRTFWLGVNIFARCHPVALLRDLSAGLGKECPPCPTLDLPTLGVKPLSRLCEWEVRSGGGRVASIVSGRLRAPSCSRGPLARPFCPRQAPRTPARRTGTCSARTRCPTRCRASTGTRSASSWRACPSPTPASRGSSPSTSPCWTTPTR